MFQYSESYIDILPRTDHRKVAFHILLGTCGGSGYVEGSIERAKVLRTRVLERMCRPTCIREHCRRKINFDALDHQNLPGDSLQCHIDIRDQHLERRTRNFSYKNREFETFQLFRTTAQHPRGYACGSTS